MPAIATPPARQAFLDSEFIMFGFSKRLVRQGLLTAMTAIALIATNANAQPTAQPLDDHPDKYQWLEEVSSDRSLAWVRAENERSAKVLESDPRFATLQAEALKILESPDRLPIPVFREGEIYNTWQDAEHVRGIVRRTSLSDYLSAQPHWQTVIDYDALAKQDNEKWVQKGLNCLYPGDGLCLVALSAGGEDAVTMREFDLKTSKFIDGGFVLPKSKQSVSWVDKDTLLVARDWGAGTMTKSGYPFVVKLWKRGQPLDQAKEVFRGTETDVLAGAATLHDDDGHQVTLAYRGVNFFEREVSLLEPDGAKRISLPGKSSPSALFKNQLIVTLDEDWTPTGSSTEIAQGSVVSLDLDALGKDPVHLKPVIVFAPTATEFAQGVDTTRNHLLVSTLENVQGRAYIYSLGAKGEWTRKKLDVPENQTLDLVTGNSSDDRFFVSLTGYLTPSSLLLGDASGRP